MKGRTRAACRKAEKQAVFENTMKDIMASQAAKWGRKRDKEGPAGHSLGNMTGFKNTIKPYFAGNTADTFSGVVGCNGREKLDRFLG